MFYRDKIEGLVSLLRARGVSLYHACQYKDFVSYLELGGVPSRFVLELGDLESTPFATDEADQKNGVWDKVFFNLEDFGRTFANGGRAVPNPYGPVLLRLRPSVLLGAEDVAVCLRSAGTRGFDRRRESLKTVGEVNRLFWKRMGEGRDLNLLKFSEVLRSEFRPDAGKVEISCTCATGVLPFSGLTEIVVDPYTIRGVKLHRMVQQAAERAGLRVRIGIRRHTKIGSDAYDRLASLVDERTQSLTSLTARTKHSSLGDWARALRGRKLEYQFERFADYLRSGTLKPVIAKLEGDVAPNDLDAAPVYSYGLHEDHEPYEDYDQAEDEIRLLVQEAYRDMEAWSHSRDEGWYYGDENWTYDDREWDHLDEE